MWNIKKLLYLLTSYERRRAMLLLVMILFMALLDMLGVASIMPFIAVLTNPNLVETNEILNTAMSSQVFLVSKLINSFYLFWVFLFLYC